LRTSSAKAKGRRACAELREMLLAAAPHLSPDDIVVTPSGVTGPDLYLSPAAKETYPIAVECKNQESVQIWAALAQAYAHAAGTSLVPILAFRRNRSTLHVAMPAAEFLRLLRRGCGPK
jgi:hypothetical protein